MWRGGLVITSILTFFASQASAVFSDEANVIDWQRQQIGVVSDIITVELPHHEEPSLTSTLFGVYTESNIFAVLNASDESLLWRRQFPDSIKFHKIVSLGESKSTILLSTSSEVDGASSSKLFQWDMRDGALIWELPLEGEVTAVSYNSDGSLYVATGHVVHSINLDSGISILSIWPDSKIDINFVGFVKFPKTLLAIGETSNGLFVYPIDLAESLFRVDGLVALTEVSGSSLIHASPEGLVSWKEKGNVKIGKIQESGSLSDTISEQGDNALFSLKAGFVTSRDRCVVYDLESLAELYVLEASLSVSTVSGNDDVFVIVDADGTLSEVEAMTGEILRQFSLSFRGLPSAIGGIRLALLVQQPNGVLQLVDPTHENIIWERDESLANIVSALILDLPDFSEGTLDVEELWYEEHSNLLSAYIRRVTRHLSDLKYLPHALKEIMLSIVSVDSAELQLARANNFGLRKYFVAVSETGRVTALDTFLKGTTAWAIDGVKVEGAKVYADDNIIYILCKDGTLTTIDGLVGEVLEITKLELEKDEAVEKVVETYTDEEKTIIAWTSQDNLIFLGGRELESFYTTKVNTKNVQGYTYVEGRFTKTWEFSVPEGYEIVTSASRSPLDVTINIGDILGDRTVLYKYLHKNVLAIAATSASTNTLSVYLLDSVTGRILHSKRHEDSVDSSKGVQLVYGEHWLVYSFWSDLPTLGEKMVVWDLYESDIPNERATTDTVYSSFDDFPLPHVKAQSFFLPSHVTAMTLSRTRFGVTVRDVIASTTNNQIIDISKRVLEPRRPVGRAPTSDESGEGLYTYEPTLRLDVSKQVLSHSQSVLGAREILTAPARLESTSLVVAYGLDVFFTRVSPSRQFDILNSSFAKDKLVYTMCAMFLVVMYLKPLVAKRMANMKWGVE